MFAVNSSPSPWVAIRSLCESGGFFHAGSAKSQSVRHDTNLMHLPASKARSPVKAAANLMRVRQASVTPYVAGLAANVATTVSTLVTVAAVKRRTLRKVFSPKSCRQALSAEDAQPKDGCLTLERSLNQNEESKDGEIEDREGERDEMLLEGAPEAHFPRQIYHDEADLCAKWWQSLETPPDDVAPPSSIFFSQPPPDRDDMLVVHNAGMVPQALDLLRKRRDTDTFFVATSIVNPGYYSRIRCVCIYGAERGGSSQWWTVKRLEEDPDVLRTGGLRILVDGLMVREFHEFFEDARFRKVYHKFADFRFALHIAGVRHAGFWADTTHATRLWDASIESGSSVGRNWMAANILHQPYPEEPAPPNSETPGLSEMENWMRFMDYAAMFVYKLWSVLHAKLQVVPHKVAGKPIPALVTLLDFYEQYWRPFGELLSDIEVRGIGVSMLTIKGMYKNSLLERANLEGKVKSWLRKTFRKKYGRKNVMNMNIDKMNLKSDKQLQILLFGGWQHEKDRSLKLPKSEKFPPHIAAREPKLWLWRDRDQAGMGSKFGYDEVLRLPTEYASNNVGVRTLRRWCQERGLRQNGTKMQLIDRLKAANNFWATKHDQQQCRGLDRQLKDIGVITDQKGIQLGAASKARVEPVPVHSPVQVRSLGFKPEAYTSGDMPSTSSDALDLLTKNQREMLGDEGALAIRDLIRYMKVDGEVCSFLKPLLVEHTWKSRVHSSFGLNTETGRLSSRRPNLQNQPPSLRKCFTAGKGRMFVVADYAQLELRVVAHLADCAPMREVLNSGGDLHSATAAKMFAYVQAEVDAKIVLVDDSNCEATQDKALLKDRFPKERSRAKKLNFEILYGKTARGLAHDLNIPLTEANDTINAWYKAYPEILAWKKRMAAELQRTGSVLTLLGRARPFAKTLATMGRDNDRKAWNAMLRAAMNAPVQGSAADVVTLAMLNIERSELLRKLGFILLHQVHDEVVLEGPKESAQQALEEVVRLMRDPLPFKLSVNLDVSADTGKTWAEGK